MTNWYTKTTPIKKTAAGFGTDPFGPSELSDKTRVSPWGNAGGDEHFGLLEPSTGKNAPNRYIEEDDKNPLVEKRLEELKKKRRKRKKRQQRFNNFKEFYQQIKKKAQWGGDSSTFDNWGGSKWFSETYKEIMGRGEEDQQLTNNQPPEKQQTETVSIKSILEATITINAVSDGNREIGSGFFIGQNTILTCAHVALPNFSENNLVITVKSNKNEFPSRLVAYDINIDIAIVTIEDENFRFENYLKLGNSGQISPGEEIITIGTPLGFENVVGKGIVSSMPVDYVEENKQKKYIFVSTNINPGNSGGPVVKTQNGSVIGIAASVINTAQGGDSGLNAAIPIDVVKPFLKQNNVKFEFSG